MGQNHRFKQGHKAPNNGVYIEVGDTGDGVKHPKQVKLKAGDTFPETSNNRREYIKRPKP